MKNKAFLADKLIPSFAGGNGEHETDKQYDEKEDSL